MGNYPSQEIAAISGEFVGTTVSCLRDLQKLGIPKTDEELKERIDDYFNFCVDNQFRPGIESLCLSLSTSRQNFWVWCSGGGGKSKEWQQNCLKAKQTIIAFLESCGLSGRLNPATMIFCLKNWAGYTDSSTLEAFIEDPNSTSMSELPTFDMKTGRLEKI